MNSDAKLEKNSKYFDQFIGHTSSLSIDDKIITRGHTILDSIMLDSIMDALKSKDYEKFLDIVEAECNYTKKDFIELSLEISRRTEK
jgi:hypothetical protein